MWKRLSFKKYIATSYAISGLFVVQNFAIAQKSNTVISIIIGEQWFHAPVVKPVYLQGMACHFQPFMVLS